MPAPLRQEPRENIAPGIDDRRAGSAILASMNRAERRRMEKLSGSAPPLALLHEAAQHHRLGQLAEAESLYRAFLAKAPRHAQGLHLLGLVCHQGGRHAEAALLIADAERSAPTDPEIPYNLGNCLLQDGRPEQAVPAFQRALSLRPGRPDALNNLGNAYQRLNRLDEAIGAYREALQSEPGRLDSLSNLGHALQALRQFDESIAAYREVLAREPGHATAKHMVAAMSGETPTAAPDEFVQSLFDGYAETFEAHLTTALGYDPNRYVSVLRGAVGAGHRFVRAVDLGCGTGLAAPLLRPLADHLAGVDLSPGMIAQAETKRLYDALTVAGIEAFLDGTTERFDLFFAADVFVYVGALEQVFAKAAARALPGAWFAFSAERHEGEGFVLRSTGRYAHSLGYLTDVMARAGWDLRAEEVQTARTENGAAIPAYAVAAQRR